MTSLLGSIIPFLAPISIAMLHMVALPSTPIFSIVSPQNSAVLYVAPAIPIVPIMFRMMSFGAMYSFSSPVMFILMASGTMNHVFPVAHTMARSVAPIPVENAPKAPYVHVCESAPTMTFPGSTSPISGTTWWQIPSP